MDSRSYVIFFSFFLWHINCQNVIKDATLKDFWFGKSFRLNGTGRQWAEPQDGDSSDTCSNGEEAEMWLVTNSVDNSEVLHDVALYVDIEAKITDCGLNKCFQDGFELFRYRGDDVPVIPYDPSKPNLESERKNTREYFRKHFVFFGNITGNTTTEEIVNLTFPFHLKKFRRVTFGIKSRGGCGHVSRIKLYYFSCKGEYIDSVFLNETLSPANGTKLVYGNCSANSHGSGNNQLRAYCHRDGYWITNRTNKCLCDEGYEPTTDKGCSHCKENWYKPLRAEKCRKCPKNTISSMNYTTCDCEKGFYEYPSGSKSEKPPNCYAPLKLDRDQLEIKQYKGYVNVTWLSPANNGGINETVYYNVLCYVCVEESCDKKCADVQYKPAQYNLTQTYVRVSGLVVGKTYEFSVFPKNSLNDVIPKEARLFNASQKLFFEPKGDSEQATEENKFTYLVIIICVGCLIILLVVFLIAFFLRRKKEKAGLFQGLRESRVELPTMGKKMYVDPTNYDRPEDAISDFATEIDASLLYLEMLIGGGEFGDVYKGSMTGEDGKKIPVAVKTLKKDATPKSEKDFLLEASVMGQFDCPNVIRLEGVVTKYRPWMIVIEFMSNGSLDNFLKANDGRLSHLELMNMAKGVAVGMEYLAGMNFVHRDLAARNILVDGNLGCKVSDFGLSRELEATESSRGEYATTGGRIPIRWTAPEAIKYRKFSTASDVWSYGILLWEIMSFAERPYWEWDNFKVMEEVDEGFRLPSPLNCPKGVHDLMMQCWKKDRTERPNFTEINTVIDGWIQAPKTMEGDVDLSAALREWLESIKMEDYVKNFTSAGYQRPCDLFGIKEEDLKEMGISLVGHRNKILKGIRNVQGYKKGKRTLQKEISLEV